jgi:hypothetical protein
MPRFNNINSTRIQFTAAEETARDAEEARAATDKTVMDARQVSSEQKRNSGLNKLRAIGLDNDEILALWGSGILGT